MPTPHRTRPLARSVRVLRVLTFPLLAAPLLTAPLLVLGLGSTGLLAAPRPGPAAPIGAPPGPVHGPPRYRPATGFSWPLAGTPPVLRPFQAPRTPYGPGHRGVDLGGRVDEPVLAAADGLVVYAGVLAGRGVVSIEHDGLLRSTYEPLRPLITVGAFVRRGQRIGLLDPGHPGCPVSAPTQPPPAPPAPSSQAPPAPPPSAAGGSPACLHWGLRRRLDYLNPVWPDGTHVHLLPWVDPPP